MEIQSDRQITDGHTNRQLCARWTNTHLYIMRTYRQIDNKWTYRLKIETDLQTDNQILDGQTDRHLDDYGQLDS